MGTANELPFADRTAAGRQLAAHLRRWSGDPAATVVGLPRGGVPVAAQIAAVLRVPLQVLPVRKLGAPGQEELAIGAIAAGGARVLNRQLLQELDLSVAQLQQIISRESDELDRRQRRYQRAASGSSPYPHYGAGQDMTGRTVIVVDDGLATGATMRTAVAALRERGAGCVVVAVPVGAPSTCSRLEPDVDALICPHRPDPFEAVGCWYRDFRQVDDAEVEELLRTAAAGGPGS